MTDPPTDLSMFNGKPDNPELPVTIAWERLDANDYRTAIAGLGQWLDWLVPVYRVPPSVVPPCWFTHSGLIEELGHLWTGWQVTRHPEFGGGMVGLDWDNHRERATARLRELVATAGCNAATHSAKAGPRLHLDGGMWVDHLNAETLWRTERSVEVGTATAAAEVLRSAENRQDRAAEVLADIAADTARPTGAEIADAVATLDQSTAEAVPTATRRAQEARSHLEYQSRTAALLGELDRVREELVMLIVNDDSPTDLVPMAARWLELVRAIPPADEAIARAAAANAARSAAVDHLIAARARHPNVENLLPPIASQ